MAAGALEYQFKADIGDLTRGIQQIKTQLASVATAAQASSAKISADVEKAVERIRQTMPQTMGRAAQDGARRITDELQRSEGAFQNTGTRLGRAVGYGFAAAVTTAIAGAIKAGQAQSTLANQSQDTRLSAGLISSLNFAGTGKGVSTDEMTSALQKFTEVSKKAKEDAQGFYTALGNIGPGFVKAFETAPTQEARLRVLSNALASTTDEVKRAQLETEAFGTDNERLLKVLGSGAKALDEFRAQAKAAGAEVDGGLNKAQAEANRRFEQSVQIIGKDLREALAQLLPVLTAVAQGAASAAKAIGDIFAKAGVGGNATLSDDQLKIRMKALNDGLAVYQNGQQTLSNATFGLVGDAYKAKIDEKRAEIRALQDEMNKRAFAQNKPGDAQFTFANGQFVSTKTSPDRETKWKPEERAFSARPSLTPKTGSSGADRMDGIERYLSQMQRAVELAKVEYETFGKGTAERLKAVNLVRAEEVARREGRDLTEDERKKIGQMSEEQARFNDLLERARDIQQAVKSLGDTFANAIDDWIVRGTKFKDVLANLARSLASMALKGTLTGEGPIGSLLGLGGKNGGMGGIFGAIFNGLFGGGKAVGGPVSPSKGYVVGENGPEWFQPNSAGSIIPNGAQTSAATGPKITIQQTFTADASPRELAQIAGQIEAKTFNAVKMAIARGSM